MTGVVPGCPVSEGAAWTAAVPEAARAIRAIAAVAVVVAAKAAPFVLRIRIVLRIRMVRMCGGSPER
ncbi:hypothetical protein GCM10010324_20760 [Streptomyces hiroshimensis]|uniref:Uncharacterized protein n=1 Tax=Streptomyces hiroshimensis TaxID=66424 RepID=A0ABQ2Y8I3_9ACTN|nr:hypothetical protein GCM10010324_20760 [Streptomyces hiroshimensis]